MTSDFTFVEGDPFVKLLRSSAMWRRLAFFLGAGWLPVVILHLIDVHVLGRRTAEPLLSHIGLHSRFLIAIPLFLFAERSVKSLFPAFLRNIGKDLLTEDEQPRLEKIVDDERRLMTSRIALGVIAAVIVVLTLRPGYTAPAMSMAGWWYLYVSEPLFGLALAVWLWRLIVMVAMLFRLARLDLQLAPTHPDGAGGLGLLSEVPVTLAPLVMGASAVIAWRLGHDIRYHGLHVPGVTPYAVGVCILALAAFLGPFLIFYPRLYALKMSALAAYGDLTVRHGRLVERKWIRGEPVHDEPILDSPELGPVVDVNSIYQAVQNLRFLPLTKRSVIVIAGAALLPFLPVYTIEIPLREMVMKIAGALL